MDTLEDYKPFDIKTKITLLTKSSGEKFLLLKNGKYSLPIGPMGYIPKSGLCFYDVLKPIVKNKDILDLGCGEMGIISLISIIEGAKNVKAVDIDDKCIFWLNHIKSKYDFQNLAVLKSDMFQNINQKFDIIVSNPPIMPMKEVDNNTVHDSGGADGRLFLRKIMQEAISFLKDNGQLYLSAFSFLGTNTSTGNQPSLKQCALDLGYSSFEIVVNKIKTLSETSVTYKQLPYIKTIYPQMTILNNKGMPAIEFQILRLCK